MDQRAQLKKLLNEHWKLRCDLAGNQSVEDIVGAVDDGRPLENLFQRVQGGADFDLLQTLKILAEAATLVKVCVDTFIAMCSRSDRKPTAIELDKEIRATLVLDRVKEPSVTSKLESI